ncbi:C39 family peptidase [Lactobacillus delbrueckii subsp. bulgaricus]
MTGWQVLNGHKYYFAADSHMLKGVQKVGKSSYLLSKSGKLQTGLKKYGRYWYFGNKQGKPQTGLKKVKKSTYNYFSPKTFRKYFKNVNTKKAYYWVSKKSGKVTGIRLNAAPIGQRPLVTGCEIVAATMMINYAGKKVNKYQAAAATPRSSNPNLGFIGNPYSWSGTWIAPSGLARLAQKYLGRYKIMTGASLSALKKQVFSGHPVVTWVSCVDNFPNHALLLTGYNKSRIYYNDPWTGKKSSMTSSTFWNHYARFTWLGGNHRALSY